MSRIDHYAYRSKDRHKTAQFFIDTLDYRMGTEFDIKFTDTFGNLNVGDRFTYKGDRCIKIVDSIRMRAHDKAVDTKGNRTGYTAYCPDKDDWAHGMTPRNSLVVNTGTARCIVLQPPERFPNSLAEGHNFSWTTQYATATYHFAPEIFISDGTPDSIVGRWVATRGNGNYLHHQAYQVKNYEELVEKVEAWRKTGIEFASKEIVHCKDDPTMYQIFTKPLDVLGGVIIELLCRGSKGFCQANVKSLMESTKENQ